MTTKCDLDEMRHIALQKFVELAEHPEKWKYESDMFSRYSIHSFGNYAVRRNDGYSAIYLGKEVLDRALEPTLRRVKRTKKGELNKADLKKAEAELAKAMEEHNNKPVVKALKKLYDYAYEQECRKQEAKMKKDMEESCRRIKELIPADVPASAVFPPQEELKLGWVERIRGWFK